MSVAEGRHLQGYRQAPGEHSLTIWRHAGPRGGERGEKEEGGRKGCYVPNCCIRPISRSTLMQEIHISADITIEMSSCDQPVQ